MYFIFYMADGSCTPMVYAIVQSYYKASFQDFSKYYYWKYIRPGR